MSLVQVNRASRLFNTQWNFYIVIVYKRIIIWFYIYKEEMYRQKIPDLV